MALRDRIGRLEARTTPAAHEEAEVRAEACRRMSTEDLTVLSETLRRPEELGGGESLEESPWNELTEEERAAFESAWGRYEEATREARAGR